MIYKSETFNKCVYIGAHGNLSLEEAKLKATAAAVGDEFQVLEIPVGIKITGIRLFTSGLGVGVKVDVKAGKNDLVMAQNVAGATALTKPIKPIYLEDKLPLTVTIGGAQADGELLVMLEYLNVGF